MSNFNDFIDLIYTTRDKQMLTDFLISVTTEKERGELTQRIEIVKRLVAGQAQQKIAADLGVGVATVTRGSKELAQGRFKILRKPS
jgi:TrpR family trp operon transcriptional repressor